MTQDRKDMKPRLPHDPKDGRGSHPADEEARPSNLRGGVTGKWGDGDRLFHIALDQQIQIHFHKDTYLLKFGDGRVMTGRRW